MSHYVISDLHGEIDRFHRLMALIDLQPTDTLYVLGDVVDRGPAPITLLNLIRKMPNAEMILGNHEDMMLLALRPHADERSIAHWNRNGGAITRAGLEELSPQERTELLDYVRMLPVHKTIAVGNTSFYLVHGFPGDSDHEEIWGRPHLDTPNPLPDYRVIIGHTPVNELDRTEEEQAVFLEQLKKNQDHIRILHTPGYVDVDCACGYPIEERRMACLRLEDMAEFYA